MSNTKTNYEAFANWLILSDDQRKRLNLPPNLTQYGIANNISDRTLRRWKNDPVFIAIVDKKKAKQSKGISAITVDGTPAELEQDEPEAVGETSGETEDEYLAIKSTLIKGAMTGDPKYLDLYFKTYGKDFVAEEAAARTSDLAGLEMGELILQAIDAIDKDQIILYLENLGYSVTFTAETSEEGRE